MERCTLRTTEDRRGKRRVLSGWRNGNSRLTSQGYQRKSYKNTAETVEERRDMNFKFGKEEFSTSDDTDDIMKSKRHLTDKDIRIVSQRVEESWRILGLRLNFPPETLDTIATSTARRTAQNDFEKMAEHMLRLWSRLSSATVGRLAVVLWEMGHHVVALQLQP